MFGTNAFGEYAFGETATAAPVSTVTAVIISPASVTVAGGATVDFDWVIQGTNSPSQAATVSTTLGSIDSAGIVTAPVASTVNQTGLVTVTSVQDPTKSGTATFTVLGLIPPPNPTQAPILAVYSPLLGTFNVLGSLL